MWKKWFFVACSIIEALTFCFSYKNKYIFVNFVNWQGLFIINVKHRYKEQNSLKICFDECPAVMNIRANCKFLDNIFTVLSNCMNENNFLTAWSCLVLYRLIVGVQTCVYFVLCLFLGVSKWMCFPKVKLNIGNLRISNQITFQYIKVSLFPIG